MKKGKMSLEYQMFIYSTIQLLNITRAKKIVIDYFVQFNDVMVHMTPLEICYLPSLSKKYIKTILEARNKYFPPSVYVPLHRDSDFIQFLVIGMWKEIG